jgi:hypothetical protein
VYVWVVVVGKGLAEEEAEVAEVEEEAVVEAEEEVGVEAEDAEWEAVADYELVFWCLARVYFGVWYFWSYYFESRFFEVNILRFGIFI